MIDLHTHLLPGVDDGAKSPEDAVRMIRQAEEIGISALCITPHLSSNSKEDRTGKIMESFLKLRQMASDEKIGVTLHLASEIDLRIDFDSVKRLPFFFINRNRRYLFVELPLGEFPSFSEKVLFSLLIQGLSPILAHPERSLQREGDIERLEKLKDSGILIQANAGSLLGDFGKQVQTQLKRLLREDLVDLFASDAHDPSDRPIRVMAESFKAVKDASGEEKALELFQGNPERILKGELIEARKKSNRF